MELFYRSTLDRFQFQGRTPFALYDPIKEQLIHGISSLGGLQAWGNIGKGIRDALLANRPFLITNDSGAIDVNKIVNYFLPAIVLAGIFLFMALATLLIGPIVCCCIAKKSKKEIYKKSSIKIRLICGILFLAMTILLICGLTIGYFSNQAFNAGVDAVHRSAGDMIDDASSIVKTIVPNLDAKFDEATAFVVSTISFITSQVNVTGLVQNLTTPVDSIISELTLLDTNVQSLKNGLANLKIDANFAVNNGTELANSFQQIITETNNLNSAQNNVANSISFQIVAPIDVSASQTQLTAINNTNTVDFTALDSAIASLNTFPDLLDLASTVQSIFTNANNNATSLLNSLAGNFSTQINTKINELKSDLVPSLSNILNPISNDVIPQIQTQFSLISGYIYYYNNIRHAVLIAFFSTGIALTLVGFVFSFRSKKGIAKLSSGLSMITMFIFWLLCSILFVVAIALGTGCNILVNDRLAPIASQLNINTTLTNSIFDGINSCAENGNLFQVVDKLGLFQLPNITSIITQQYSQLDIPTLLNNLNITNIIDFPSFSSQQSQFSNINLSSFNFADLSKQSFLDSASGNLTQFKNNLVTLKSTVDINSFVYTPTTSDVTVKTACLDQFKADLDVIIAQIDNLNGTKIPLIQSILQRITSDGNSLIATANTSVSTFGTLMQNYNTVISTLNTFTSDTKDKLTNIILPQLLESILTFAKSVMDSISSTLNCKTVAQDILAVQNAVCVSAIQGIDTVWWSFAWCGFFTLQFILFSLICIKKFVKVPTGLTDEVRKSSKMNLQVDTNRNIRATAAFNSP